MAPILSLEDERIIHSRDRGYEHARTQVSPLPSRSINSSGVDVIHNIQKELHNAMQRKRHRCLVKFLPLLRVFQILDKNTIFLLLSNLKPFDRLPAAERRKLAGEICHGGGTYCTRPCRKLLAALILESKEEEFESLLKDGVNDDCLPLDHDEEQLKCQHAAHSHSKLAAFKLLTSHLPERTYEVSAPFVYGMPDKHVHFYLSENDILPIIGNEVISTTQPGAASTSRRMKDTTAITNQPSKDGGFGRVFRVVFNRDNFDFGCHKYLQATQVFAMKELFESDIESFKLELFSLLELQKLPDQKHLVRLLATFEMQEGESKKYYFLFPWADNNLVEFWKNNNGPERRRSLLLWMVKQCYQLAGALSQIHDGHMRHIDSMSKVPGAPKEPQENKELYGRHGDIKAENVLVYTESMTLALTDFGLSRWHSIFSRSNQDPKRMFRTGTYRAPEFDLEASNISRVSDIYSLGCMFLEFVTWQILGYDAVIDDFPSCRMTFEDKHAKVETDIFFDIQVGPDGQEEPVLKEEVCQWIQRLRDHPECTKVTNDFLDVIQFDMLHPVAATRVTSKTLLRKLDAMSRAAESEPDYVQTRAQLAKSESEFPLLNYITSSLAWMSQLVSGISNLFTRLRRFFQGWSELPGSQHTKDFSGS